MTLNVTSLAESEFDAGLRKFLTQFEGRDSRPYADKAKPSHPTIGIGFDLTQPSVRNKVFSQMGITLGSSLDAALATAINNSIGKSTAEVQAALDQAYGQQFIMTDTQIDAAFKDIAQTYVETAKKGSGLGFSTELIALTSLAFNGLFGSGLKAALQKDDPFEARADAWYQIRYVHANQLHKRRYAEAALFGLYDNSSGTSGTAEALAIYRMYTQHAKDGLASASGGMIDYDKKFTHLMSEANLDLAAAGVSRTVKSLGSELRLAAIALEGEYVVNRGLGFPGGFDPLNIQVTPKNGGTIEGEDTVTRTGSNKDLLIGGNNSDTLKGKGGDDLLLGEGESDSLYGDEGNDTLHGGSGADTLNGGAGNDKLIGGSGRDTYIVNSGEGQDTIQDDKEGAGQVIFAGKPLSGGKKSGGIYTDGTHSYALSGTTLTITGPGGSLVINNFQKRGKDEPAYLGIRLNEDDTPPPPPPPPTPPPIEDFLDDITELPFPPSPIVLDMDGNGVTTTSVNEDAHFDHDANGLREKTGWVAPGDGLLAWDRNGDGAINSGRELFGDQTLLNNGGRAANGYQALAELDQNADGKIDASDSAFDSLRVWKDADGDGQSAAGELFSLYDLGIQSIDTGYTAGTLVDAQGNAHRQTGRFTRTDGSLGDTADVWFMTDPSDSIESEYLEVPADIAALPNVLTRGMCMTCIRRWCAIAAAR